MNPEFWRERWQDKRIGFNQPDVNPLLTKYFATLKLPVDSRVLVPLCGKSIDMIWLATQGYDVVGIELVESAVQEFFSEQNISPSVSVHTDNQNIKCYKGTMSGQAIELWVGDIFLLTANDIGHVDAVYDRAALIALPTDMRPKYSEQVRNLSSGVGSDSHDAPQLLLTLNYDQSKRNGPPFSISSEQVQQYYSNYYQVNELEGESSTLNAKPDMAVTEHVWLLTNK